MKKLFNKRKINLATLLTGFVATSIILTICILMIASYQSEKESLATTYLSLNYSKSKKISDSVDSLFQSMTLSLANTSNYLMTYHDLSDEEIQQQLELLRNNSRYFNSLSWIDETGLIRNIAPVGIGLKGEKVTGITRKVLDSRTPMLTSPYIAPSGRLIVLMNQPLFDKDGNYRGMIAGAIYLQERNVLNEILGNDIIDENGSYYYVVGPDGQLLFHPDSERIGEDVISNVIVNKLTHGKSGKELVTNTQGIDMLAAYSSITSTGWGVVQQTPVSYVNKLFQNHIKEILLYLLPPFFILLGLSIFIARKLASPFIELANLVNILGSGKIVPVPENQSHWNREVDLLTKSVAIAIKSVQSNNNQLIQEATTDLLTGLPNRRKLDRVMEECTNIEEAFSLLTIDIDHFKLINDTYGHQAGDEVLKEFAILIQSLIGNEDMFFRYGGEEFVLILPKKRAPYAYFEAEELRRRVGNTNTVVGKPITISLGISEYPAHGNTLEDLFRKADKALYQSKIEGRNRTTIWINN
ncbi:sensor domain-containing diguanylate cyclase [Litchfieldia alkalitelluris]|uniref:sensor domain-containing diguanylate cyclase n=1 Tax=Litchfieldia alkalitelluris TaxID=304268 RepID=UPI000998E77B|nr:sensor domain-containing diguanylate cyclase [Litchfieldia alkalitelluris]